VRKGKGLSDKLAKIVEGLGAPRALVVGDMILDRYVWGNANRISQEAPIPVLSVVRKEWRPGGAANVANALAALGARVTVCGVAGRDDDGELLAENLRQLTQGRAKLLVDKGRPTTVKTRFVGCVQSAGRAAHHVLRVDEEVSDPIPRAVEDEALEYLARVMKDQDCVICEDYNKGMLTERLLAELIKLAKFMGLPVIVDPTVSRPFGIYSGAAVLVPNRYEAGQAARMKIVDEASARAAAVKLSAELALSACLIKLDRDGLFLYEGKDKGMLIPTEPRDVYDVTGAGDIVTAVVGAMVAEGVALEQAARIANVAAGIEVQRFGCAPVYRDEILRELRSRDQSLLRKLFTPEQLAPILAERRRRGEKVAFTNGCFDLLHQGHIELIKFSRRQGDLLVVGMNSDRSVRALKGPNRPILGQNERAGILAALAEVDYIVVFDTPEVTPLVAAIKPDVLVKGGDYRPDQVVGHDLVESYGGKVVLAPLVEGMSTTNIVARVLEKYGRENGEAGGSEGKGAK